MAQWQSPPAKEGAADAGREALQLFRKAFGCREGTAAGCDDTRIPMDTPSRCYLNGEHDDQQDDQPYSTMGFGDILVADTDVRAMSLEAVPRCGLPFMSSLLLNTQNQLKIWGHLIVTHSILSL
jgi:hypothetical protein